MQSTIFGALIAVSLVSTAAAQGTETEVLKLTVARKPSIEGLKVFGEPRVELDVGRNPSHTREPRVQVVVQIGIVVAFVTIFHLGKC